jgi:plasmid stabilization system protein ParE
MNVRWTSKANLDLVRLHDFIATKNPSAAADIVDRLVAAPDPLIKNPWIGTPLRQFEPREIRRIIVGNYEMRYEIVNGTIYILRIWHTLEDR